MARKRLRIYAKRVRDRGPGGEGYFYIPQVLRGTKVIWEGWDYGVDTKTEALALARDEKGLITTEEEYS